LTSLSEFAAAAHQMTADRDAARAGRDELTRNHEALIRDALLLADVRDSVIVTDPGGVVTYWNEAPLACSAGRPVKCWDGH
jgi:PAS domain-containing protein